MARSRRTKSTGARPPQGKPQAAQGPDDGADQARKAEDDQDTAGAPEAADAAAADGAAARKDAGTAPDEPQKDAAEADRPDLHDAAAEPGTPPDAPPDAPQKDETADERPDLYDDPDRVAGAELATGDDATAAAEPAKDESEPERPDLHGEAPDAAVLSEDLQKDGVETDRPDLYEGETEPDGAEAADSEPDVPRRAGAAVAASVPASGPEPAAQRGGFAPLVLGGAVAAVIGAAVVWIAAGAGVIDLGGGRAAAVDELQQAVAAQDSRIDELAASIDEVRGQIPDLTPLETRLQELGDRAEAISGDVAALAERIDATDGRVSELAMQPIPEAEIPAELREAFDRQLEDMQAALDRRAADMQAALDARMAELEQAQAAAGEAEADAAAAARRSAAQAALASILAALDSGAPFQEDLAALRENTDTAVPDPLDRLAETGAPTLAELQRGYPPAARAALRASVRAAADQGEVNPVTAFLRTQMGARSLAPRDGGDPDAVLSRAEAALGEGDLDTALAEVEALPEAGRGEIAAWAEEAETRRAALAAADALAEQLTAE